MDSAWNWINAMNVKVYGQIAVKSEKIAANNNIGIELHERNQSEKNNVCDGQDKSYYFYNGEYRKDASPDEMFDFE